MMGKFLEPNGFKTAQSLKETLPPLDKNLISGDSLAISKSIHSIGKLIENMAPTAKTPKLKAALANASKGAEELSETLTKTRNGLPDVDQFVKKAGASILMAML